MKKIERIILTKTPIAFVLRKSKKWHLPGFEGVPLYDVAYFFYKQIKTVGLTERASAIAYNFIMAIPPSFLFLFTLIPNLPFVSKRSIKEQLHGLIIDIVPAKVHNANLIKFVDSFIDGSKIGLLSFGLIAALFFASNGMMGIMRSFNKNYIGFAKRKGLHNRWIAIRLTALQFLLVLGCLLMLISQGVVLKWLGIKSAVVRETIFYARWLLIVTLIFYSIAFIYKFAPAVQKRWNLVSPGAILATSLSILASLGFSAFVNNFGRYNALYGSIGTIIMLMALIYINSLVLLIGFELNVSIKSLKSIAEQREIAENAAKAAPVSDI
ncbi:YihY/virulence factor BrkB family protein [Ferruginibacter lapsinanis]|uniref:YihY/virulence factor BrkB family protein n=1 Tax=Ferruginibacter lapsinanis TaxID=563172 RepID=UPI001E3E7A76|nr:YihY/virulence factor BrkB family protein [Ferruginibacter lapsinanis]UEG48898.1 YihY/virulence factor BrkB family protein [Ferruginibacter lapsinanis]